MSSVLVLSGSGAGVVRTPHGLMVTVDVEQGGGGYLRSDDRYAPERAWGAGWERCALGGLLAPGATCAEVLDELGERHEALIGEGGAYVAEIGPASQILAPVVCCRDGDGRVVRRPRGGDYSSVRVTDTQEPCPACGVVDWDEYTPTEQWRGGRSGADGERIPTPIVCCRVCGHEEPEGVFFGRRGSPADGEDEAMYARRVAVARAQARHQRWLSDTMTLRAADFPIYLTDDLHARVAGSASQGEIQTAVTVHQCAELTSEEPLSEQTPSLAVTTAVREHTNRDGLADLRDTLGQWIDRSNPGGVWPEASNAAITLWIHARQRERRARTLRATQDRCTLTIDGALKTATRLRTVDGLWAAYVDHDDLLLTVCASDIDAASLRLQPLADPERLLGPEPPTPDA